MANCTRRQTLAAGLTLVTGAIAGCTDVIVDAPEPILLDMQQGLADRSEETVAVTVEIENQGGTGDVEVEIRALDSDDEPTNSVTEVVEFDEDETREVTVEIEASAETTQFEAVAEPA